MVEVVREHPVAGARRCPFAGFVSPWRGPTGSKWEAIRSGLCFARCASQGPDDRGASLNREAVCRGCPTQGHGLAAPPTRRGTGTADGTSSPVVVEIAAARAHLVAQPLVHEIGSSYVPAQIPLQTQSRGTASRRLPLCTDSYVRIHLVVCMHMECRAPIDGTQRPTEGRREVAKVVPVEEP